LRTVRRNLEGHDNPASVIRRESLRQIIAHEVVVSEEVRLRGARAAPGRAPHDKRHCLRITRGADRPRRVGARQLIQDGLESRAEVRIGLGRIGQHRQRQRNLGLAGLAHVLAHEPGRRGLELDLRACCGIRRRSDRHRQQQIALVAVPDDVPLVILQHLGRRPLDVAGLPSRGERPGQARRESRARVDPVRVPVRLMDEAQGHRERLSRLDRGVLRDERGLHLRPQALHHSGGEQDG
jgi:hypothetical protein